LRNLQRFGPTFALATNQGSSTKTGRSSGLESSSPLSRGSSAASRAGLSWSLKRH
jgi:hypothetical protein